MVTRKSVDPNTCKNSHQRKHLACRFDQCSAVSWQNVWNIVHYTRTNPVERGLWNRSVGCLLGVTITSIARGLYTFKTNSMTSQYCPQQKCWRIRIYCIPQTVGITANKTRNYLHQDIQHMACHADAHDCVVITRSACCTHKMWVQQRPMTGAPWWLCQIPEQQYPAESHKARTGPRN